MKSKNTSKSPLLVIFLVVFIDLLGFGIVIPIMPYYAKQFGATTTQLGFLMASYSLMQLIFSPIWGRISDRIGRKPVILISLFGTAVSLAILGSATSLLWLFVGRVFSGICGGNISTAAAYITDITTPENRAKGMGLIGASFGLGFIFGPAIGGILSRFGYGVPMYFAAVLAVLNTISAYFILHEAKASIEIRMKNRGRNGDSKNSKSGVLTDIRTSSAILLFFICTLAFTQIEVSFALYMLARFNFGAEQSGWMLALMGTIGAVIQGGLIGKLSKRFGEVKLISAGTLLVAVGLAISVYISAFIGFLFGFILVGIGNGFNNPSLSSLASKGSHPEKRGLTMGYYHSAGSLARVLGPVFGGFIFDRLGHSAPFLSSSLIYMVAFTIFIGLSRKIIKQDQVGENFSLQSNSH